jgi:hypothetical protein
LWTEGIVSLDEVLDHLLQGRGWIAVAPDGRYGLTSAGEAAHARLAARVEATRRRALDGVTPDEYQVTVRTLRRMSENLATATG